MLSKITGKQILFLWVICIVGLGNSALAVNEPAGLSDSLDLNNEQTDVGYAYIMDDRSDPFVPFISKAVVPRRNEKDEIIKEDKVLTGMQLFEPGQLQVVAIMSTDGIFQAMVQDVTGRGYILEEGMLIGRNGLITSILDDEVVVIDMAHTRAGRTIETKISMRMDKEGE